jgi:hypothetical protein
MPGRQQVVVPAPLEDPAGVEHENLIGGGDGRKAVGDRDRRPAAPDDTADECRPARGHHLGIDGVGHADGRRTDWERHVPHVMYVDAHRTGAQVVEPKIREVSVVMSAPEPPARVAGIAVRIPAKPKR